MNVIPTLEGGLRIDVEAPGEWQVLLDIVHHAVGPGPDLASRLGAMVGEDAGGEDWQEYVVPDLREGFQDDLRHVHEAVEAAHADAEGEEGHLWIKPEDAGAWYSSLNQARLAIEEVFHFGPGDAIEPMLLNPRQRSAFARSHLYSSIQGMLLEYVMR